MRCADVAPLATAYSAGALDPIRAFRVRGHLAGCDDCNAYVEEMQAVARALPALVADAAQPPLEAMTAFRQWQGRRAGLPAHERREQVFFPAPVRGVVALTAMSAVLGTAAAHQHAPMGLPWLLGGGAMLIACGLAWLAPRRGGLAWVLSILAIAAPAMLATSHELGWSLGLRCALHELVTAAIPVVALLLQRRVRISAGTLAGMAGAGALAGDAALHIACSSAGSALHVLVFHVGGVVLAGALAGPLLAGWFDGRREAR